MVANGDRERLPERRFWCGRKRNSDQIARAKLISKLGSLPGLVWNDN